VRGSKRNKGVRVRVKRKENERAEGEEEEKIRTLKYQLLA
jgi:hypothetical protein